VSESDHRDRMSTFRPIPNAPAGLGIPETNVSLGVEGTAVPCTAEHLDSDTLFGESFRFRRVLALEPMTSAGVTRNEMAEVAAHGVGGTDCLAQPRDSRVNRPRDRS
jgi:hypothetical protein